MKKTDVLCLAVAATAGLLIFASTHKSVAGTVPVSQIETFLGLPSNAVVNQFGGTVGHAMKITFSAQSNDIVGPVYKWLTNENPVQDTAFMSVVVGGNVDFLAGMPTGALVSSATPFDREGQNWTGFSRQIAAGSGTIAVVLGLGLVDDGDGMIDSAILVDRVSRAGFPIDDFADGTLNNWQVLGDARVVDASLGTSPLTGGHMALLGIPEPTSFALVGLTTLALLIRPGEPQSRFQGL